MVLELVLAGHLTRFGQGGGKQGIVVEHFFEMRHQPAVICAVARQPAADLVVDAAVFHGQQRLFDHGQAVQIARAVIVPEEEG